MSVGQRKTFQTPAAFLKTVFKPPDYRDASSLSHFYGIDLARGLAALAILVWHYQHFFMAAGASGAGKDASQLDHTVEPLYGVLFPLYEYGFWAVEAFWVISGFVFAHVYAGKKTTAGAFAGARFARLYPLHFITLITIGTIQAISFALLGSYQIVGGNGPVAFAQNLLFIGGWGLPRGGNFNGPIWSVSVEIAIYALFFLIARRVFAFGLLLPVFIIVICWCMIHVPGPLWNFPLCGYFFFIGVSVYWWLLSFRHRPWAIILPSLVLFAVFVYLVASGESADMRFYDVQVFAFMPAVLLFGWAEFHLGLRKKLAPLQWFGDVTYSTYLWHFPIQVAILTGLLYFRLYDEAIFRWPPSIIIWVIGMVAIARVSFLYIEKPSQIFVKRMLRNAASVPDRG